MHNNHFDKIIIGAGLYGLYAAVKSAEKGESVLVLEYDSAAFMRATYINQARVHNGYHYPRSFSTAIKSAGYFEKFNRDFDFCVNFEFRKIYAISSKYSWTNAEQFRKFCRAANIQCENVNPEMYFKKNTCDGVFDTQEYTYDAIILRDYFLEKIRKYPNIVCEYNSRISSIEKDERNSLYHIALSKEKIFSTGYLLNATYASVNQIHRLLNIEPFKIKYELCEIILCQVSSELQNVGITVMDGPFFSLMPFGKTGLHSLTSVTFTPHITSYEKLPTFPCQNDSNVECSPAQLGNCNLCFGKPKSAWPYMSTLAKKYLKDMIDVKYVDSLFSMKPILMASEIDDSRPTVIRKICENPTFVSVLSGKINTMYDLDEVL